MNQSLMNPEKYSPLLFAACLVITGCQTHDSHEAAVQKPKDGSNPAHQPVEFTRMIAHWSGYADPGYLSFVDDVKPEVVQVGFYGALFWSLAAVQKPKDGSNPAHQPVEFTRMIAHWSGYADPGYLSFVDDVKPEVVQVGFYGALFWSLAAVQKPKDGSNPAHQPVEFTRMIAHWSGYADPGYLSFVDDVKPEVVQVGFYGAHFWSLAAVQKPKDGSNPAHQPVEFTRMIAHWSGYA